MRLIKKNINLIGKNSLPFGDFRTQCFFTPQKNAVLAESPSGSQYHVLPVVSFDYTFDFKLTANNKKRHIVQTGPQTP